MGKKGKSKRSKAPAKQQKEDQYTVPQFDRSFNGYSIGSTN